MGKELEFKSGAGINLSVNAAEKSITIAADQVVTALSGNETDKAPCVEAVNDALAGKVSTVSGKGLSTNDYTTAEKTKLAGLQGSHFKGEYTSITALQAITGAAGDYAYVDTGVGQDVAAYVWDTTDNKWVEQKGVTTAETAASVKQKYESNPDTNAYTDSEKTKLSGIATGAEVNQNAFTSIKAGAVTISATSKTDTFSLVASSGITFTVNAAAKTVTIGADVNTILQDAYTLIKVNGVSL